ncbi:DUF2502 domain-containing protein [Pluralibacter gergoviae]
MIRGLILSAILLAATPFMANANEITLLPSVKLNIGDRDRIGHYWDGGRWRDRDYWRKHYEWRNERWHRYERERNRHHAYDRGYREGWRDRDHRDDRWHRGPPGPPGPHHGPDFGPGHDRHHH